MAFHHFLDGYRLDSGKVGDETFVAVKGTSVAGQIPDAKVSDFAVPGRHGMTPVLDGAFGAAAYTVRCVITAPSREAATLRLTELNRRFTVRHRLLELRRTGVGLDRVAYCQLVSSTQPEGYEAKPDGTWMHVSYLLDIPDGRWWDAQETAYSVTPGENVLLTPLVGGSAPFMPVFIIVGNGSGTSVKLTNPTTGAWISFTGSVPTGTKVWVFADRFQAVRDDGVELSGMLNYGPTPFILEPDARVTITQNGTMPVEFRARRAWFE